MRRAAIGLLVLTAAGIALAEPLLSHGGHDENIRLISSERGTQLRFVVSADHLMWFDTNRDGQLSRIEFDRQAEAMDDYVDGCLGARSRSGDLLTPVTRDHPVPGYGDLGPDDAVKRVRIIRAYAAEPRKDIVQSVDFTCFPSEHGRRNIIAVGSPALEQAEFTSDGSVLVIR